MLFRWSIAGRDKHRAFSQERPGFIFLMSVLFFGAMAVSALSSLLLLGWAAEQNAHTLTSSMQSLEYTRTCVERVVQIIRNNPSLEYNGPPTIPFPAGTGTYGIFVEGTGNNNRRVCVVGHQGKTVHRLLVAIESLVPLKVQNWREVSFDALCGDSESSASS